MSKMALHATVATHTASQARERLKSFWRSDMGDFLDPNSVQKRVEHWALNPAGPRLNPNVAAAGGALSARPARSRPTMNNVAPPAASTPPVIAKIVARFPALTAARRASLPSGPHTLPTQSLDESEF